MQLSATKCKSDATQCNDGANNCIYAAIGSNDVGETMGSEKRQRTRRRRALAGQAGAVHSLRRERTAAWHLANSCVHTADWQSAIRQIANPIANLRYEGGAIIGSNSAFPGRRHVSVGGQFPPQTALEVLNVLFFRGRMVNVYRRMSALVM